MKASVHLKQVVDDFLSHVRSNYSATQAERIINEFLTALYRYVLPVWGLKRKDLQAKMQAAEKQEAEALLKTLAVEMLLNLPAAFEQGLDLLKATKSSRSTYGGRIRLFLKWAKNQYYYPGNSGFTPRSPDECRPKMRHGRGDWKAFSLMEEKGKQLSYRLKSADISPQVRQQLAQFLSFMADLDDLDRCFDELEESTASGYYKGVLLWLGWTLYYDDPSLNPAELTLKTLLPQIFEDNLEGLTAKQRKATWKKAERELEARINRYFEFLRVQNNADSPRTRLLKLATLLILAKFLYASEVEEKADYRSIPLIRTILKRMETEQKAVKVWEKARHYVADQSRKWPEPPAGQTVLEYTQESVIEPLRLECRPRQSTGDFCKGRIIAKSLLFYLLFTDVGLLPPGRQQEPRSYRIALSCPLKRPDTVPMEGVYWPLPPDWTREKRQRDGSLNDNFLFKVYHYEGESYEQGVWIREKCRYKTQKHHGKRAGVIDNIMFEDGQCLYDYIERYLCGQWYVGDFRQGHRYDWWKADLRGSYGKWLSQGRAELCSADTPVFMREGKSEVWVSSYLFINPKSGKPFTDVQMSDLFARNSFRILGKRITPHTFRYMWVTWAFQMGLSDAELESLATGMGLTVKTMRKMYERCSLIEKNRLINKAMRKLFPWQVQQEPSQEQGDRLAHLKESISKMSSAELEELRKMLGTGPAA
ncbi:hypothetical protein NDI45_24975 [Leptolyngbya sp. GB1-A1]|uniref:hypothetical protein n=1 Tax=Leptolyngbya sp. GB1-A1 TaxID=2933908 RepID=UPI003296EBB5